MSVDAATAASPGFAAAQRQLSALPAGQGAGLLADQVTNQSYLLSTNDIGWICAWAIVAAIVLIWLARKPAPSDIIVAE